MAQQLLGGGRNFNVAGIDPGAPGRSDLDVCGNSDGIRGPSAGAPLEVYPMDIGKNPESLAVPTHARQLGVPQVRCS
jgi:hypothetical protein